MQFIDIIRRMNTDQLIRVGDASGNSYKDFKLSQIMKVGNIPWKKLRRWEYLNVSHIGPSVRGETMYLFVRLDNREKDFYSR